VESQQSFLMAKVGRLVKESSIHELGTLLTGRPNFFVTAISRLPAPEADLLRQKLAQSRSSLMMVKRRLGLRALEPLKISGLAELLEGSVGLVLSGDDVLHTAKLIVEFRKSREEQVLVRGAVIDGQLVDPARVEELAHLPPKPMLLALVVATIESPITDVIMTIEQLIGDLAWVMEQTAAKKSAEAPALAALAAEAKPPTEPGPTPVGGAGEGSPDAGGGGTPTEEGKPS
jgi:large subunit ribosomal protein L10